MSVRVYVKEKVKVKIFFNKRKERKGMCKKKRWGIPVVGFDPTSSGV